MIIKEKKVIIGSSKLFNTYTQLGNYYGYLSLIKKGEKYYLSLEAHLSTNYLEIDQVTSENLLRFSEVKTQKSI